MSSTPPPSYGEGERVFGPPNGAYDADWVASLALQNDPGLPPDTARLLAVTAWELLRGGPLDAPELARRLLAAHPQPGASAATVVATAALAYVEAYGL